MKIHFLLIYSLPGLRSLPKYFQNVAAFIINSGSNFLIFFFLQSNAIYLFQYSPSFETDIRDGKAM